MGRVTVRQAVADYLIAANISYVGQIYPARPVIMQENAYEVNMMGQVVTSDNGSGCVIVVNLPTDDRQRRALTGRGAVNDTWIHDIALELWFASTSGQGVQAQADYDLVVDQLVIAIRANPVLGTVGNPVRIWSAGEFAAGVSHEQRAPYTDDDGTTVFIPGVVKFQAWEWIAGTNV